MGEGGVRQLTLCDNVLAAHGHSGTPHPSSFYFTLFFFLPYFMDVGHVGASLPFPVLDR